jgi:hypothetical protein
MTILTAKRRPALPLCIFTVLTLQHPFATSWPSSPQGDARGNVAFPRFPLRGNAAKRQKVYEAERRYETPLPICPPNSGLMYLSASSQFLPTPFTAHAVPLRPDGKRLTWFSGRVAPLRTKFACHLQAGGGKFLCTWPFPPQWEACHWIFRSPMGSLRIQFPCHLKGTQDFTAYSLFPKEGAGVSVAFSRFPLRENAVERQKGVRGEASV